MTTASGLAAVGALISLVAAFLAFGSVSDSLDEAITIGLMMLVAVMFFAVSGSLGTNGQRSWKASMFFVFLTGVMIVVAFLYGKTVNSILVILQVLVILAVPVLISSNRSADWINLHQA